MWTALMTVIRTKPERGILILYLIILYGHFPIGFKNTDFHSFICEL